MAHNVTVRKCLDQRGPYTEEVTVLLVPGPLYAVHEYTSKPVWGEAEKQVWPA